MRTLCFAVLLAMFCIAGCGEEPTALAPETPELVGLPTAVAVEDHERILARVPSSATVRTALADFQKAHESKFALPGTGMNIVVPDPAQGIYTCQDAVDAAAPGATITVLPGSVFEDVLLNVPDIVFRTSGPVDLHGTLYVVADRVTITGFNVLMPPTPTASPGIYVANTDGARVLDNTLSGWTSRAIFLDASRNALVENNRILSSYIGVHMVGAIGVRLSANTLSDLTLAVCAEKCAAGLIEKSAISDAMFAITLVWGSGNTIDATKLDTHNSGITLCDTEGNFVTANRFTSGNCGVRLLRSHGNEILDNNILYARRDGFLLDCSNANQLKRNDTGSGADGVHLTGTSAGNALVGTLALGHTGRGIVLDANTADNLVTLSEAYGNAGCDIVNYGVGNVFVDNDAGCTFGF